MSVAYMALMFRCRRFYFVLVTTPRGVLPMNIVFLVGSLGIILANLKRRCGPNMRRMETAGPKKQCIKLECQNKTSHCLVYPYYTLFRFPVLPAARVGRVYNFLSSLYPFLKPIVPPLDYVPTRCLARPRAGSFFPVGICPKARFYRPGWQHPS
jgi:hypothetical protein